MADENLEGLEGLDDFGDDFGDQLDSFMEGDEDEGDSELDSFFEDLSTIDDLEMKEDGGAEPEATPEEAPVEDSEPEAAEAAEETEEAPAAAAPAPAAEEKPAEKKKEEKKAAKPKKEKKSGPRKPILIPALITSVTGMVLGAITVGILYFLNMPEGVPEELAELMVGRKVLLRVDKTPAQPGANVLEVKALRVVDSSGVQRLKGVDLTVRAGEVLGIAGVAGNGQSELLAVLGGYQSATGSVSINQTPIPISSAAEAQTRRGNGLSHVPEDRQHEGLIMEFSAWENIVFGYHTDAAYQNGFLMDNTGIKSEALAKMERFDIRPPDPRLRARNFSGGNQQKIVLAREIERDPDILLIGQPTRGVDIGAIEFIHQKIIALRDRGKAILLVSVELDEILSLSDRIAVMFDGRIMGERLTHETNEKELGLLMAGIETRSA